MTFLNPAVLFGLLAASIPVLIHLLNLRKLKRIDFSTLSFLKEMQKNKIRKVKLKQWLLLALRVLIVIMLVMAFARPALKGTTIGGAASSAKTTAVFIIDDTFSMSVIGTKGSYLNFAKETVKNIVRKLQEGDEAALILISGMGGEDIKTTSNLADFTRKVESVQLSHASGFIHNAMVKASEIISASKNFNKEIYLLSDFQDNRISADKQLSDFSEIFNENVKLYGFNFSGKEVYNLAVTGLKVQTQIFEKDKPAVFEVTVTNYSSDNVSDAVISIFENGNRSAQRSLDIDAGKAVTVEMEAVLNKTGFIEFSAVLQDDEILQDNRRYLSLFIPEEIPVLMLYEKEEDVRFIEIPIMIAGENNPLKVIKRNLNQLQSLNLSNYKVVILSGPADGQAASALKSFSENGGGLMLFPASGSGSEQYSAFLRRMSLPQINGVSGLKGNTSAISRFGNIDVDHPVFQNIFLNQNKKIESPEIYFNYKIIPSGSGRNIISVSDGSSFMSEYTAGKGRIFLFSSLPELHWNNLPLKGIFPPLIYKSVLYLSFSNTAEDQEHLAGNPVMINLSGKPVPQLLIEHPDGSSETINIQGESFFNYQSTDLSGVYTLKTEGEIFDKIAVNTDPAESGTKYISDDDFDSYLQNIGFRGKYSEIDPAGNPEEQITQARFGSELWKLFAVLTLLLALAEMTVARTMKRDLAVI